MTIYKKFRLENRYTQKEMANKLGISFCGYRNYELGQRVMHPKILIKFLKLRNEDYDKKIVEVLEEIYD